MRLGLHYWTFSTPSEPTRIAPTLAETARVAEQGGFATFTVMDHWFQMEQAGSAAEPMLEAYTTLGHVAALTERMTLGVLVTGVMYRHPGLLAKTVTTLDVLSGGRARLGIGASWYEREQRGLGVPVVPVAERFERFSGGRLVEGYGLSESSPVAIANPIYGKRKAGTIGMPIPDTLARVADPSQPDRTMPAGEPGELALAGPQVMLGYWNRPDETAQVLQDGWLLTGDMAVMDEEGYFSIVDRKKDLIIAGGYNIYPREVEEVLYEHPKVLEVCVAGVPDSYRGEIVKAFVVLRSGEQATVEEIREFAKGRLAGYKVPRSVEFRDDLPKTLIGKVLRRALVEEEQARQARQTAESGAETAVRPAEQGPRTQAESRAESP